MKRQYPITARRESGSTLVLTVVILMIVMILGTTLMLGAVTHLKLAEDSKTWSSDYYALDGDAETVLKHIDQNLQYAETFATAYFSNRMYEINPADSPNLPIPYELEDSDTHVFSVETLNFNDLEAVGDETLSNDALYFTEGVGGQSYQMYFYQKYISEVASVYDPLDEHGSESLTALEKAYTEEAFNEVYFLVARTLLEKAYAGLATITFAGNYDDGKYQPELTCARTVTHTSSLDSSGSTEQAIDFSVRVIDPDFEPVVETQHKVFETNPVWTYGITAGGGITLTGDTNIYGSLYASSLNSAGILTTSKGITVSSGTHDIYGNVYTRGMLTLLGDETTFDVKMKDSGGISYDTAYKRNVYDENGVDPSFYVEDATIGEADTSSDVTVSEQSSYTGNKSDYFWFYNRDDLGGNIYAKDVKALEDTASTNSEGVQLSAENVWTYGDIIMEASETSSGKAASISIAQNAIGLLNTSTATSPNDSSTILNNSFDDGGEISLAKAYVPGRAFIGFDKFEDVSYPDKYYFETLESITGNDTRLFSEIYDRNIGKSTTADLKKYTYVVDIDGEATDVEFYLNPNLSSEYNTSAELVDMLSNVKGGSTNSETIEARIENNVITGVNLSYAKEDFDTSSGSQKALINIPGLIVAHLMNGSAHEQYASAVPSNKADMISASALIKERMKFSYLFKTMAFGFNVGNLDLDTATVDDVVSQNVEESVQISGISSAFTADQANGNTQKVQYITAVTKTVDIDDSNQNVAIFSDNSTQRTQLTLNLTRDFRGIVYVDGDLILNLSDGCDFSGSIIATGDVTVNQVSGSSSIIYDESAIARMINLYPSIKAFFSPFEKGPEANYTLTRYTSGMFTGLERFRIVKWKEKMYEH